MKNICILVSTSFSYMRCKVLYLLSFVETPRKFIIAIINLRGVSTKLNKYIVFTMKTYKKLIMYGIVFMKENELSKVFLFTF